MHVDYPSCIYYVSYSYKADANSKQQCHFLWFGFKPKGKYQSGGLEYLLVSCSEAGKFFWNNEPSITKHLLLITVLLIKEKEEKKKNHFINWEIDFFPPLHSFTHTRLKYTHEHTGSTDMHTALPLGHLGVQCTSTVPRK